MLKIEIHLIFGQLHDATDNKRFDFHGFTIVSTYFDILTKHSFPTEFVNYYIFFRINKFFRMEDALDITLQKYNRREWAREGKNKFIEKKRIWSLIRRIRIFIH